MPAANVTFHSITTVQASNQTVETSSLFDASHREEEMSPVDLFIKNTNKINMIYMSGVPLSRELGVLVLLGYMSAVESYFRALFRSLVNVDEYSKRLVEPLNVTYAAAMHHKPDVLAEALLEEYSFASVYNVKEALKAFVAIKGKMPPEVEKVFRDYQKICEMRHCCVHRFGRLGAKNAIRLGLDTHREILEKPLLLTTHSLQDIAEAIRNFVKTLNNFIFKTLLERTATNKVEDGKKPYSSVWSWDYRKDQVRFKKYYEVFSSRHDAQPSPGIKVVYDSFRGCFKN